MIIIDNLLALITALVGIVSVIISVCTLKQNSRMIEESTRPYVVIYLAQVNFQNPNLYLVIKNFGKTGATINTFYSSLALSAISHTGTELFKGIEKSFIAPGQSYVSVIDVLKLPTEKNVTFKIKYSTETKNYSEEFEINLGSYHNVLSSRANTKDKELKIISYSLQDLVEKHL